MRKGENLGENNLGGKVRILVEGGGGEGSGCWGLGWGLGSSRAGSKGAGGDDRGIRECGGQVLLVRSWSACGQEAFC